ncbi:hypothetical protein AAHC03_09959 [Spirometra sp. Aus1]
MPSGGRSSRLSSLWRHAGSHVGRANPVDPVTLATATKIAFNASHNPARVLIYGFCRHHSRPAAADVGPTERVAVDNKISTLDRIALKLLTALSGDPRPPAAQHPVSLVVNTNIVIYGYNRRSDADMKP